MEWFLLYDNGLRHERVNEVGSQSPSKYLMGFELGILLNVNATP